MTFDRATVVAQMLSMERRISSIPNLRLLVAGIAVGLLGIFGIGAVMAWVPAPDDVAGIHSVPDRIPVQPDDSEHFRSKCPECGVVESARVFNKPGDEIDHGVSGLETRGGRNRAKKLIRISEVTIRMSDGASHQYRDESPANWRQGERVIFIAGANRSND